MKISPILCITLCLICLFCGCSSSQGLKTPIDAPNKISTFDETELEQNPNAVEKSNNVNAMRYNLNLEEFSARYNQMLKEMGNLEMINGKGWQKKGDKTTDSNGVAIQYYFYDANKVSFTATVEVESNKLMNIGIGTTMSNFVSFEDNENYSDVVLMKSAVMAAAACGYTTDKVDVLQDIFYRTTFEGTNELWYEGNVYCLSTSEDKSNSERSIMLFRVFPISDEIKSEWKIIDYEQYIATMPNIAN